MVVINHKMAGRPALSIAVSLGRQAIVRRLLRVCDVDARDSKGQTALMRASEAGDAAMVHLLLQQGRACPAVGDAGGHTALMLACMAKRAAVVQLLLQGPGLDAADHEGNTALVWASFLGLEGIVAALVAAQASLDSRDNAGCTALAHAARSARPDIAQRLLSAGADPNIPAHTGMTPLMMAASSKCPRTTAHLLSFGAALHAQDPSGNTALLLAARGNDTPVLTHLLAATAKLILEAPCRNTVFVCPRAATRSAIAKALLAEPGLAVKEQDQVTLLLWADSEEHDAPLQAFLRTLDVLDLCVQVAVPFRLGKKKRKAPQKKEEGTPCRNTVFVCPHAATRSAIAKVLLAEPGLVVKEQDQVTLL
eukprot:gene15625-23849_t